MPGWLPSEYLARVAALAPGDVAEVILSIDTENERVHRDFAEAALAMPGPLAAKIAQARAKWLGRQTHLYFGLSLELADLVGHLVETGEVDAAFDLAGTLLALKTQPDGSPQLAGSGAVSSRSGHTRRRCGRYTGPSCRRPARTLEAARRAAASVVGSAHASRRRTGRTMPFEFVVLAWTPTTDGSRCRPVRCSRPYGMSHGAHC